jgi:hypothetical protein
MTDSLGIGLPLVPPPPAVPPAPAAPVVELLSAPPALQAAANVAATILGRSPEGAVLLRTSLGMATIKTTLPLPPSGQIELRLQPGNPPTATIVSMQEGEAAEPAAPPMRLDLGTTVTATVIAPAPDGGAEAPAVGSHLLLRVIAPMPNPGAAALAGQIGLSAAGETVVETPLGVLALGLRLALPPGTAIAFERLAASAPALLVEATPSQASSWPTLDQALASLDKVAPNLAQQFRAELTPRSAPALAGTLLFLMDAIYRGRWPGERIESALLQAGQEKLKQRLGDDLAELTRLSDDPATGEWRVFVLPLLLAGPTVQPLRFYLRRRAKPPETPSAEEARFVIEAELSRLGALQLDGLLRGKRLDLVLRSHQPLAAELRAEASAIFHQASATAGLHGDLVFATSARFAVAPEAGLRRHLELRI